MLQKSKLAYLFKYATVKCNALCSPSNTTTYIHKTAAENNFINEISNEHLKYKHKATACK